MSLKDIKKIVENLPDSEKNKPIVFIEGKIYTWTQCKQIIEQDEHSDLAKKIISKLNEIIE